MPKNLFELFEQNVERTPDKTAIVFKDNDISYQAFYTHVKTLAFHLNRIGVKKGSHIAIFENNSIEFATIMLSCAYLGATIVPLPMTLKGINRERVLENSDCDFVIGRHAVILQLYQNREFKPTQLIALGKRVESCYLYDDFLIEQKDFIIDYEVPIETNYILTMTSGSTGDPKPIIFSQKTKITRAFTATKDVYGLSDKDVILVSTPLYHSLAQRSLLLPLVMGGTAIILSKFTPRQWLESVEKHRISFLFAVSTQLVALVKAMKAGQYDLSSLKVIVSSSALLKEDIKEKLLKLFKCDVYECYGASEVGVVTNLMVKEKTGSVGRALPFVEMKLVEGEIVCKSITEFEGYYNNPEATAKAYDDQGYFHTGDMGEMDADGYLYYKGRIKDIINTGAINVYPQDIEEVINGLESVAECAVVGMEDDHFGEIIVAVMSPAKGYGITIKEIRKKCLESLTDYQIPQRFEIIDQFPKGGLGKILKGELKIQLAEKYGA